MSHNELLARLVAAYDQWHAFGIEGLETFSDEDATLFLHDLQQKVDTARKKGRDQAAAIGCYAAVGMLRCLFDLRKRRQ